MNFTPQERMDILNKGNWSKDVVRRLIRDCETLEKVIPIVKEIEKEYRFDGNTNFLKLRNWLSRLESKEGK